MTKITLCNVKGYARIYSYVNKGAHEVHRKNCLLYLSVVSISRVLEKIDKQQLN